MDDYIIKNKLSGRKVTGEIIVPQRHRKYIKSTKFFAYYDTDIYADPSIINIPLLATILPLAWITGSDVHLNVIDRRFKESMDHLQQDFKKTYSLGPFTTKIKAKKLTDNKISLIDTEAKTALLFSGGVDSTYSMVKNLEHKPRLLMIWGVDNFPYPENKSQWDLIFSTYSEQANRLKLPINLIQTNITQILDEKRINHAFHKVLYNGSFRFLFQHSLILLPLMAPISIGRFNKLLIASSTGPSRDFTKLPWGSNPSIDEQMVWADLTVRHDGVIERVEKITSIKPFLDKYNLLLKVCLKKLDRPELNDGNCEKCIRTMITLILSGIDPNTCGFKVDSSTFMIMKEILSGQVDKRYLVHLAPIQKTIPPGFEFDLSGSKEFYEWFRNYQFKPLGNITKFYKTYYNLPYPVARFFNYIYRKLGIPIHDPTPLLS